MMTTSTSAVEGCYAGIKNMLTGAEMARTYHYNMVMASGGVDGTKNKLEQSRLQNADWVLLGTRSGMAEIFEDRFEAETGVEFPTCVDAAGVTTWGEEACVSVLSAYKTAKTIGALPIYYDAVEAEGVDGALTICHEGDDATLPTFTGATNCALKQLANGMMQWVWKGSVSCQDPATFTSYTGTPDCM